MSAYGRRWFLVRHPPPAELFRRTSSGNNFMTTFQNAGGIFREWLRIFMPEQRVFGTPYLSGGIKWWPTAKSVRNPKLKQHRRMRRFHFHLQPNLPCAAWNIGSQMLTIIFPHPPPVFKITARGSLLWIVINSPCPSCTLCQWMDGCGTWGGI